MTMEDGLRLRHVSRLSCPIDSSAFDPGREGVGWPFKPVLVSYIIRKVMLMLMHYQDLCRHVKMGTKLKFLS